MLDIFNNDAFGITSLTNAVNEMPFVPGAAGRLGVFAEAGIATTSLAIERRAGVLNLIPTQQRGEPPLKYTDPDRQLIPLIAPHHPVETYIKADELQNVRAFGSPDMLQGPTAVVNQRLSEMISSHDATVEYGRIGAIKGIVYDADGTTVLIDLFAAFGLTQVVINFVLGTQTTEIKVKVLEVMRAMELALGSMSFQGIYAFCGETFWEELIVHSIVKEAYDRWQDSAYLRQDPREGFPFAGCFWERYRGMVVNPDGNTVKFVADTDAHFFPVQAPGLFHTKFAPADFMETVNTIGLPRYAKIAADPRFNQFVEAHTQSNALSYCTRPGALVKGTNS